MTFDLTTKMTLSHLLLTMPMNKELDHQIYSKMLRKIFKKEVYIYRYRYMVPNIYIPI